MGVGTSLRVLANDRMWRLVGSDAAGRAVISAATSSDDEDASMLAAMLLTRGGDRSVPLLEDAVAAGQSDPIVVDVLASIGTPAAMAALGELAQHEDDDLASAARSALDRVLPPGDEPGQVGE